MRKRVIGAAPTDVDTTPEPQWLDVEKLAQVEVTSEDSEHPVDALVPGGESGWRAAQPGEQTIRLIFSTACSG